MPKLSESRVIALFLMATQLIAGSARTSDWNADLKFQIFAERINNKSCAHDPWMYLACIHGLDTVLALEKLAIVPNSRLQAQGDLFGPVKIDFGNASIVERKLPSGDEMRRIAKSKRLSKELFLKERNEFVEYWLPLAKAPDSLDFEALLQWVKNEVISSSNESTVTATGMNAYFAIARDPHSGLVPKRSYAQTENQPKETLGTGIGLSIVHGKLVLLDPIPESPAELAGLRKNDVLTAIDGAPISALGTRGVIDALRGEKGSPVQISVIRPDHGPLDFNLVRDTVTFGNVIGRMMDNVGYLQIVTFRNPQTCSDVKKQFDKMKTSGLSALVLDLRNNKGGDIDQAHCVASLLLPSGLPFASLDYFEEEKKENVLMTGEPSLMERLLGKQAITPLEKFPVILLTNAGTGSSAEMLAGSLQDHNRAYLLGDRTYGKGSFQSPNELKDYPDVIQLLTEGLFRLPSQRYLQQVGLKPDFQVFSAPSPSEDEIYADREENTYYAPIAARETQWVNPRLAEISKLNECMKREGKALSHFHNVRSDQLTPDFQLESALDLLSCIIPTQ